MQKSMKRKTDFQRDIKLLSTELFASQKQKAELEAQNVLLQFDELQRIISDVKRGVKFQLRPSTLLSFHHIAIHDIYTCAGNYRTRWIGIKGSEHETPSWLEVPKLVEEMCDYINDHWDSASPIHLSSYLMWRINWIHPFFGGNGRTSRAISYLALCAKLGYNLPVKRTIPEQIVKDRQSYYDALDAADKEWEKNNLDVSLMEELLTTLLERQLIEIIKEATKL